MTTFTRKLAINEFVRRQTRDSEFSHYEGGLSDVLTLAMEHWPIAVEENGHPIMCVTVPAAGFFCGVVKVTADTKLESSLTRRQEIEEGYIKTVALGAEKIPGVEAVLIFYSHATLAIKDEQTFEDAEYELISMNVNEEKGAQSPETPEAMARNFLDKPGGSKRDYTARQFAEAIDYWKDRVMNGGVR